MTDMNEEKSPKSPPRRREPWPIVLAIVIVVFVAATAATVIYVSRERVDLVSRSAYEQGEKYQRRMDARGRAMSLDGKPVIAYEKDVRECAVRFPASARAGLQKGTVSFFRPDDASRDFSLPLSLDEGGEQRVGMSPENAGHWRVRLSWTAGGLEYFYEQRIEVE